MTATQRWRPRRDDPLMIMAMDHRDSFGRTLFGVVRDNPDFDANRRRRQLSDLAAVSEQLRKVDVPLLYELLVSATPAQLESAGGDTDRCDRDLRPALVAQVIADNQAHDVEPALWKVEGFETA